MLGLVVVVEATKTDPPLRTRLTRVTSQNKVFRVLLTQNESVLTGIELARTELETSVK